MRDPAAREPSAWRAISADAELLRRIGRGFRGRVHSAFERTVNVEVEDGELVTLACRSADDAPDTVVVDIEGLGGVGIECGDPVHAGAGALRAGPFEVRLDGVSSWSGALPVFPRDDATLRANLCSIEARISPAARGSRMRGRRNLTDRFADEARAALDQRAAMLRASLLRADLGASRAWAAAMIGLGPGLTPSGDDFLVGLFATLNIALSPCYPLRAICGEVVEFARSSTNAISVAALANAARGRVRESIGALARELIDGTPARLGDALDRVLAIGATSGAEIVAGLAFGFAVNLEPCSWAITSRARCLLPEGRRRLRETPSMHS